MSREIGHCGKCNWKGDIGEADQRTEDEILYLLCPRGCEVEVAPKRPINASEDYFANIILNIFKEKSKNYNCGHGQLPRAQGPWLVT
jgi:hypothetical protein